MGSVCESVSVKHPIFRLAKIDSAAEISAPDLLRCSMLLEKFIVTCPIFPQLATCWSSIAISGRTI